MSPICHHCGMYGLTQTGTVKKIREHLLLFYPKKEAKWQRYSGDSTNITDVFPDSDNLVELLISSKHLLPPSPLTGTG